MRKWSWLIAPVLAAAVAGPARADDDLDRVQKVLREHPEIIVEAIRQQGPAVLEVIETTARNRQKEMERARFASELAKPLKPALDAGRAALGPQDAAVTIVDIPISCAISAPGVRYGQKLLRTTQGRAPGVQAFRTGKTSPAALISRSSTSRPQAGLDLHGQGLRRPKRTVTEKGDEAWVAMAKELGVDWSGARTWNARPWPTGHGDFKKPGFRLTGTPIFSTMARRCAGRAA